MQQKEAVQDLDIERDDIGPSYPRDIELLVPDRRSGPLLLLRPEELLRIVDHRHVRVCASAVDTGEFSASEDYELHGGHDTKQ